MFFGKRLDMRTIADPGGAVYKRTFQGKKTDAAVCVLVDNSDSMMGQRMEAAKQLPLPYMIFAGMLEFPGSCIWAPYGMATVIINPSEETV